MGTLFGMIGLVVLFLAAGELFRDPRPEDPRAWGDDSPLLDRRDHSAADP